MVKLSILGASGSIGKQALQVADWQPEQIEIVALSAGHNWRFLADMAYKYRPALVAIADESKYTQLRAALSGLPTQVVAGESGVEQAASCAQADTVLAAISGMAGLRPLLAAIEAEKRICLANKEALVAAGQLVMDLLRKKQLVLNPVDSEHSAIWQCLAGESQAEVSRLILTASGGAFRDFSAEQLLAATAQQALQHPNWRMGAKITIDCATMVNKGLEVIEARWLFDIPYEKIEVLVHPQSIIHSMVAYQDGSIKAQLALPDMRLPIQYALLNQARPTTAVPAPDLGALRQPSFYAPDSQRFPALDIIRRAGEMGGIAPAFINGANEVLNQAFLLEQISFVAISDALAELLATLRNQSADNLDAIFAADHLGREGAQKYVETHMRRESI